MKKKIRWKLFFKPWFWAGIADLIIGWAAVKKRAKTLKLDQDPVMGPWWKTAVTLFDQLVD